MRTVTSKNEFLTVKDLRDFLNSDAGMELNENAFIWVPNGEADWEIDCAVEAQIEKVSTPEDGHPQESGLVISCKRVRNKV